MNEWMNDWLNEWNWNELKWVEVKWNEMEVEWHGMEMIEWFVWMHEWILQDPFTMSSVRVQEENPGWSGVSCWPPRCNQEMPHTSSRCHLLQDLLGLNVTYTVAAGQVESYMSVAGCATPNNSSDRGCGPEGPSVAWWRFAVRLVPRAGISFLLSRKPADRQGLVVGCERREFRGSGGSGWLLIIGVKMVEIQLI